MFTVTVQNRSAARKILRVLTGLPASTVYSWSLADLTAALVKHAESITDDGARAAWIVNVQTALREAGAVPAPDRSIVRAPDVPAPAPSPDVVTPRPDAPDVRPAIRGALGLGDALDAAIRGAVSEALRDAPQALDTAAVERIVRDVVDAGGILPPSTITVKVGERTVVEVSGIRHYLFETVLKALAAGEHLWLPGPAGSGKSTLARQALQALGYTDGAKERGIHMTGAVETVFQLIGYVSPNGDDRTLYTPLRLAVEFGGGFIFDDVDRSNPKALAAFNEGLANGYWTFPDRVIKQHADFICIATANTFGLGGGGDYVGAARMDKATLDRFTFIAVPYDETAESMIAGRENAKWTRHVQSVRKAVAALGLKHLVTPRATYRGVKLLAAGLDVADVESMTIYAGLDAETVQRIRGAL